MAKPREKRCKRRMFGVGSYCMNRSNEESHCSCPCHKRKEPVDVQTQKQKAAQQRLDKRRAQLLMARAKHVEQTKALGRTMKRIAQLERSVAALERSVTKLALEPAQLRAMDV
jgi:hypothetical protein